MQKIEIYNDILDAKWGMEEYIRKGWRVRTCTMSCYEAGYEISEKILVVYDRLKE